MRLVPIAAVLAASCSPLNPSLRSSPFDDECQQRCRSDGRQHKLDCLRDSSDEDAVRRCSALGDAIAERCEANECRR